MSVVVRGVGWVVSGHASEGRAGDLFDGVHASVAEIPVRPVPHDLRPLLTRPPERLARTDRLCQLSLVAVERALADFGAPLPSPAAVVHESGLATIGTNDAFYRKLLRRGARGVDPKRFPYTSPNAAPGEIAIAFGLHGPNLAVLPGLTGGLSALAVADRLLRHGRAGSAVVVGADVLSPAAIAWLAATGEGIAATGEGSVALVLVRAGPGASLARISETFDAARGRSLRIDPADVEVDDAGDLPGASGLYAIARAARAGRRVAVEASGIGGIVVTAEVSKAR